MAIECDEHVSAGVSVSLSAAAAALQGLSPHHSHLGTDKGRKRGKGGLVDEKALPMSGVRGQTGGSEKTALT